MNKTTIKIGAFVLLAALCFGWHVKDKQEGISEAVERATSDLIAKYDKALRLEQEKALKASNDLQAKADKDRQERDDKINRINADLNVALIELRKRPERPSDYTPNPDNPSTCTGAELYREDAEFLAREAARAERVKQERDYYYQSYEEVRKKVNGTTE